MNYINDIDLIERYFNNQLTSEELAAFQQRRANDADFDQDVVTHRFFLQSLDNYSELKDIKSKLAEAQANFSTWEKERNTPTFKNKVVSIFKKYKKTITVAASIGGVTAILCSGIINYMQPATAPAEIQKLSRELDIIKKNQAYQRNRIQEVASKIPKGATVKSGGSAFLIDKEGYVITNAHVLNGSGAILVNKKGQEFKANIIYIDQNRDLAILQITDKDFKIDQKIPYTIQRAHTDLGQDIFTLGYPRNEIVYNTGYLSAESGHEGDTSTIQLSMLANPGNSGGPIFNNNGDIVGVLSTRETKAEGVSYAIKANEIYQMIDDWKHTDTTINDLTANQITASKKRDIHKENRVEKIKDLSNFVYMVKVH